jgi:predicted ATPase/DNA-binding SARP family transcriptional activator
MQGLMARTSPRGRQLDFPQAARIPVHLTPLVGRRRELEELRALVKARRLLSLVGSGGAGKTRLAAAIAEEQAAQRCAVAWLDLAGLRDAALLPGHVAAVLGARERPGGATADGIIDLLGGTRVLLVLDSCEHLVGACAVLADALLHGCPSLRIVTTSRQALGVAGEKAWLVPPLALPAPGEPVELAGAVQLFVERAQDALPSFALSPDNADAVGRICRRLDGLPLAIELAAARVRLLPPEQLATRLDDVFGLTAGPTHTGLPRHRTLRALIDWSYDLLHPPERALLERLSVFAGGFSLDAVEHVAAFDPLPAGGALDLLASLVDQSLVVMNEWHGEARYSLLETVRQYGADRLRDAVATHAEALRRRHGLFYLDLAEAAAGQLHGPAQLESLDRIELEHDNLRAALAWSLAAGDAEVALRLCLALRDFWRIRGHLSEARQRLDDALALPAACGGLRARALAAAAVIGRMQGDYLFLERLAQCEAVARSAGDRVALADALTQLGASLREQQRLDEACSRLDEAIALWRELGDSWGLSLALAARASVALALGDVSGARNRRLEAIELSRGAGDREGEARGWLGLGEVARLAGDLDEARGCNERALQLFAEIGDSWHAGSIHQNLGWIHAESGRPALSFDAFSESSTLFFRAGNPFGVVLCLFGFARLLHDLGQHDDAAIALATASWHAEQVAGGVSAPADAVCSAHTRSLIEASLDADRLARARQEGAGVALPAAIERARGPIEPRLGRGPGSRTATGPAPLATVPPTAPQIAPQIAPPVPLSIAGAALAGAPAAAWGQPPVVIPDLSVTTLGPLRISVGDRPVDNAAFGSSKPRELLLLLLMHPEGCTREQVGLAFWPDASTAQVKNSFHVTLHRLRRALPHPEWIVVSGDRYRFDPAVTVALDALRFEADATAALRRLAADAPGAVHAAVALDAPGALNAPAALDAALALYGGDFLDGEVVGDWHLEIRDRLRHLYHQVLLARGTVLLDAGRWSEAATTLSTLLARDPLHEEAWRMLMVSYVRNGERPRALRTFDQLASLLRAELGADPDERTTLLMERIRRAEAV